MQINETKSYTEYTTTEPTTDFVVGFEYFNNKSIDTVNITVDNTDAVTAGYTVSKVNNSVFRLTPAVPSGRTVRLVRETDLDAPIYKFSEGALFRAPNVDTNFKQILHAQQEVSDGFSKLDRDTITRLSLQDLAVEANTTVANQAKTIATNATNTANTANTNASSALNKANQAITVSNQASTTANNAKVNADKALEQTTTVLDIQNAGLTMYPTIAEGLAKSKEDDYFHVISSNDNTIAALYRKVNGVAVDQGKVYPSSTALDGLGGTWYNKVGGYDLYARVKLTGGEIVKSIVANNTNNPNVDMTGWVKTNSTSQIVDASGKSQQQINDRVLYFSDFITVMNGVVSNNSQFVTALIQANGREIYLQKGEIIRLTSELDLAALNVNIVGDGKIVIDHAGTGFITTGHVRIHGNIEFDGLVKSWCAYWANGGASKRNLIGMHVTFKNFYSTTFTEVVRSSCGVNIADGFHFENIRALGDGVVGNSNGVVRAFYIHGTQSFSQLKNGDVKNLNTVNSSGVVIQEDADAIHFTGGRHIVETKSIDFQNVGKRWIKLQGTVGSKCVAREITGSSAFTGTTDNDTVLSNGMYAPISIYGGELEVDGLTMSGGVCLAAVTIGTALVTKVTLNNVTYTPEYHDYVEKLGTRFVLIENDTTNARVTIGSGCYSNETRIGVDSLSEIPYLNINSTNITVRRIAVTQRAKDLHVTDNQFIRSGSDSGTSSAVIVAIQTENVNIKNNNCIGAFQDGVTIASGRSFELYGSISGNIGNSVTRSVVQKNESVYAERVSIGANFGTGAMVNAYIGGQHIFRNQSGVLQALLTDSGMNFIFETATTANLNSKASSINTSNKRARKPVLDTTTNKLMIATGALDTSTWISADGVTTITPT